jgi:UDP-N-acetylmuramoyl-tripeptide--D-alanyl-D-alanine ligase
MWLIFLIALPFFLIRGLRWLAIVQQKEYRWDRLKIFLTSQEGSKDFWTLWPPKQWLSRTGLKRPVRTSRILIITLLVTFVLILVASILINLGNFLLLVVLLAITYLFLPLLIMFSLAPTVIVAQLVTHFTLKRAQQKILAGQPLVIGITGSYGKTSTKLLLAHLLSKKYSVFATPKSYNTRYSVAKAILDNYQNQQIAVIEYAAYTQGEIKTLAQWFKPQIAVITGLAAQHLELFRSITNIIQAKAELIKALPANAPVFCNAADQGATKICQAGHAKSLINYSGSASDVELKHVGLTNQGTLTFVWHGHTIVTKLVGLHYQNNAAGAIAVAEHLGVSELDIVQGLQSFQPSNAFTQIKQGIHQSLLIDDGGTTNPTGFEAALQLIKVFKRQNYKTILITAGIIDLGSDTSSIHQDLAIKAEPVVDEVWYLGVDGLNEFQQKFGQRLLNQKSGILNRLKNIDQNSAILIEGKLPLWMKKIYANF